MFSLWKEDVLPTYNDEKEPHLKGIVRVAQELRNESHAGSMRLRLHHTLPRSP
jgi:hypothetical protein